MVGQRKLVGEGIGVRGAGPRPFRRWAWAAVVGAVILALLVGLGLHQVRTSAPGAKAELEWTATRYLDAIVEGDGPRVLDFQEDRGSGSSALLRPDVLAATPDRVDGYSIDRVSMTGPRNGTIRLTLHRGEDSEPFTLRWTDRSRPGALRSDWRVVSGRLPEIEPRLPLRTSDLNIETVLVNSVEVPLAELMDSGLHGVSPHPALMVLPGTYEISLPERGEFVTPPVQTFTAPLSLDGVRGPQQQLDYELTAAGEEELRGLVTAALEHCALSGLSTPRDCPLDAADAAGEHEPGAHGDWELQQIPQVTIQHGGLGGARWVLEGAGGQARFTPTQGSGEPVQVPLAPTYRAHLLTDGGLALEAFRPATEEDEG